MTSNFNKKNSLCKYYVSYGDCFHGDNCQYIHSRDPSALLSDQHHPSQSQSQQPGTSFPTPTAIAMTANINRNSTSFTLSEDSKELRDDIFRRQQAKAVSLNAILMPTDAEILETLPERISDYTDLFPIKRSATIGGRSNLLSSVFGCVCSIYRAFNINTNQTVCLRRIHSFQPNSPNAKSLLATVEAWKKFQNSFMVRLLQVFTTNDFGDVSLILVYNYYPQAVTMMQQYFNDPQSSGAGGAGSIYGFSATNRPYSQQHAILKTRLLPENLLWHYVIQISAAIRLIHSQGLAYRIIDPTKVLITTKVPKCPPSQLQPYQYPRIRLNACGLFDIISLDHTIREQTNNAKFYQNLQQDDLVSFGRLCLALATNNLANAQTGQWDQAMELVIRTYSADMKNLIWTLLTTKEPTSRRTVADIMPIIGARFYVQLNLSYEVLDNAQAEIDREALNGKLFRLLVKLSMINDRPELRLDPSWSETGDRYMLKLFREYLFHQLNEDGAPWLDTGHVVSTLLKFDSGSPEKICLISRDEQHVLVVSFAELKKCFETAFAELTA